MTEFPRVIIQFWGKADRQNPKKTLPAIYHMIDVALVAEAIFEALPKAEKQALLSPFLNSSNPKAVLFWLIALHDIGKLTPGFQYKLAERYLLLDINLFPKKDGCEGFHGKSSFVILRHTFQSCLSVGREAATALATSVASHHGVFEKTYDPHWEKQGQYGRGNWQTVQRQAIEWLLQQFSLSWKDIQVDEEQLSTSWLVYMAGFCSVADWIGSDSTWFPYDVLDYNAVKTARKRAAEEAIEDLGLKSLSLANSSFSFAQSFGFSPNALQQQCLALRAKAPKLCVIEAPMGGGKTEAALILAHSMAAEYQCAGLYVAMPTQASSNQLYDRITAWLTTLDGVDASIQNHLLHANADLNLSYQAVQAGSIDGFENANNVAASQWFTGRKRGLLASCAVGTIDQLLMAGMRVKHNFVRLFALANKVVVLDEVHAVDAFQLELLCNLLGWLAQLGSPVILLSATLPDFMREKLFAAYNRQGLISTPTAQYPRLSLLHNTQVESIHIGELEAESRRYLFESVVGIHHSVVERIAANVLEEVAGAGGGVIVCIVNTVQAAQQLFGLLNKAIGSAGDSDAQPETLLFHARFPLFQRLDIEAKIKEMLGANKENRALPNPKRKHCILVGTQVLEQSLDYSGDRLHTELAPMDLLLQRAGRLHRHAANEQLMPSCFHKAVCKVYMPEVDSAGEKSADDIFGYANAKIYPPSLLEKTASYIADAGGSLNVSLPEDIDTLVQAVYSADDLGVNDWHILDNYEKKQEAVIARQMLFDCTEPDVDEFLEDYNSPYDDNLHITTRLAMPSVSLVLLVPSVEGWRTACDGELIVFENHADAELIRRFKQSSVAISNQKWVSHFGDSYQCEFWQQNSHKALWQKTSLLYGCVPVCLDSNLSYLAAGIGKLVWDKQLGVCFG